MRPIRFPQANVHLGPPQGMTEEECGSLDVLTDGETCVSLWIPSWKERLSILFFGKVWLWVYSGQTQPPVALEAKKSIFKTGLDFAKEK